MDVAAGDRLELVSLSHCHDGESYVVARHGSKSVPMQLIHLPLDSGIEVLPMAVAGRCMPSAAKGPPALPPDHPSLRKGAGMIPPALPPDHPSLRKGAMMEDGNPRKADTGRAVPSESAPLEESGRRQGAASHVNSRPMRPRNSIDRQAGDEPQSVLASFVRRGGRLSVPVVETSGNEFFLDVLKEGWLAKLPPSGNRFKTWRRRWFRLVITLNRSFLGGPVQLQYFEKPGSSDPKGVGHH